MLQRMKSQDLKEDPFWKIPPLDFAIIGGVRSGCTGLWATLLHHPDLSLPVVPNLCVFGRDLIRMTLRPLIEEEYLSLFASKRGSPNLKRGDICTLWLSSRYGVEEILSLNASTKLVVILRNPLDTISSMVRQISSAYGMTLTTENFLTFEDFWKSGKNLPERIPILQILFVSHHIRYGTYLRAVMDKIQDRKQLHVIAYEEWVHNPQKVLARLFEFLGVQHANVPIRFQDSSCLLKTHAKLPVRWLDKRTPHVAYRIGNFLFGRTRPSQNNPEKGSGSYPPAILEVIGTEIQILSTLRVLPDEIIDRWKKKFKEVNCAC